MKINEHNYEAFFLDFVEGRLDNSSTLELLVFLNQHPTLKEELENYDELRISPGETIFQEKDKLKKLDFTSGIYPGNFESYCIAYHERILSREASEQLFAYLDRYPAKKHEFELYGKTYLAVDKNIVFDAKPFLKRKVSWSTGKIILHLSAVAAGIVLLISVFFKSPSHKMASRTETIAVNKQSMTQLPEAVSAGSPNFPEVRSHAVNTVSKKRFLKTMESKNVSVQEENLEYIEPISIASLQDPYENGNFTDDPAFVLTERSSGTIRTAAENKAAGDKTAKKLTLWDIAQFSLKEYNKISENDIILHRETDENGKLSALAIETVNGRYGFDTKN